MPSFSQYFPGDLNDVIFSRQRLRRAEGRVSLPAAITTTTTGWVTVTTFTLPRTDQGYLTAYSNEVIDPSWDYNAAIQFRMLVNGSPVDDCDIFSEFRGSVSNPADAFFFMKPGSQLVMQCRRSIVGVAARDVVMGAVMQTWPQTLSSSFADGKNDHSDGRRRLR